MTCNNTLASSRRPRSLTRALALVLLVLIGYGAIAGAAHSHGSLVVPLVQDTAGTSLNESNRDGSSSRTLLNNGECLVCQLHRNLLDALTTPALATNPVIARLSHINTTTVFYSMETGISQHGRAPPVVA